MASVHELAQKALRDKWDKLIKTKTINELMDCFGVRCSFCKRHKILSYQFDSDPRCPLMIGQCHRRTDICCDGEYVKIIRMYGTGKSFKTIHAQIMVIYNRIKALLDEPDRDW